jgi:hypothetical protein
MKSCKQTNDESINLDGLRLAFRLLSSSSLNLGIHQPKHLFTHMNEAQMNKCIFYSYE